jgi:prevent-host-death family protein
MRSESISSAKNRLSALIKEVQGGESVLITDRGVPVAQLVPVKAGRGVPARVIALAQQGLARLPERPPSAKWLDLPRPKLRPGPSPVEGLLAERREGR